MKKEKSPHNYKKTRIDIICDILVKVVLPCIVIGIMLLITFTSHASSGEEETPEYPMIIDFAKNPIDTSLEEIQNAYSIMWGDLPDSYVIYCSAHDNIYINGSHGWDYYDCYNYTISVNPVFDYPLELSVTSPYYYITNGIEYYFEYIPDIDRWGGYNSATNIRHQYAYSYMSQGLGWILYGTEEDYTSIQNVVVWAHTHETPITLGHATPPNELQNPIYIQGHARPEHVPPTITVNNYSWSTYTPPTVDNSTLEKLLESLTDIVKYNATYLKDNLHNEFTNLINNIKNLIDFIGQTIQYYGDLIIENIQNLITTFYNNMLSLFEPISTVIDYISQPLDMDSLTDTVNSTQIFDDVDTCTIFANDAFGIYGTVAEPNTFKIPLDLRSISLLNITQVYYIDLSWLDGAKSAIRAFMWCVVTFGLLYSVIVDIPNMIRSSK